MALTKNTRIIYLYEKQEKKCYYCGQNLWLGDDVIECNIDHKQPTSRGGKDTIDNVVLSCTPCNSAKANLTEDEFLPIIDKIRSGEFKHKDVQDYAKYMQLKKKFEQLQA